jgi:hypothetical protein
VATHAASAWESSVPGFDSWRPQIAVDRRSPAAIVSA